MALFLFVFSQCGQLKDLLNLFASVWSTSIKGASMFRVLSKLKLVKQALKTWNKSVFDILSNNTLQAQTSLQEI